MKTFTKTIAIAALTLSSIGFANAANILVPGDEYFTTKMCLTASQGKTIKLHKAIKEARLSKQYVVENVKCNGQDFIAFIEQYGLDVQRVNNFITSGAYSETVEMPDLVSR